VHEHELTAATAEPVSEAPAAPAAPAPAPAATAEELLARGDHRGAVAALMDAHGQAIFGYCLRVLRECQLAEDVLQQVFLEAYRDLPRFQGRSALRTWLLSIASHRCLDSMKARRRHLRRVVSDEDAVIGSADPAAAPTERLDQVKLTAALEACMDSLSHEVRMTVLLRFHAGLSYEEMADSLKAKPDTLQTRVARALPVLRRCLEGKGWNGE
jgi:RNA polymerase sigma factor (sigma-70 family)